MNTNLTFYFSLKLHNHMDEQYDQQTPPPPPPPPPQQQSLDSQHYLFTPSLPPPPPPPFHQNNQFQSNNIDWLNLLNYSNGLSSSQTNRQILENTTCLASTSSTTQSEGTSIARDDGSTRERKRGPSRKATRPRFEFQTRSADDILDDGYRWRKYGQKSVKNSTHPRSYYRCTHHTCNVKKQVQRLSTDTSIVVTTYEGIHNHPCEKLMETLAPLLKQMQFLSSLSSS